MDRCKELNFEHEERSTSNSSSDETATDLSYKSQKEYCFASSLLCCKVGDKVRAGEKFRSFRDNAPEHQMQSSLMLNVRRYAAKDDDKLWREYRKKVSIAFICCG